ncbi:uncharacterized protein LOC111681250 [Lucilia cuprina]|uniref:uncharacterized protein LOC111681250 n=1 Tax=Lucilia cuprina TaxID=7375 RepID=UPI001F061C4A|nr:uncharacterized protein LOC111681250 [Lucilia cuprina]
MLSFFLKKKQSPDTAPEEVIQGPATEPAPNNGADDFIFVEKKGNDGPTPPQPSAHHMYPPMPPAFGVAPYPPMPYPPHGAHSTATINTNQSAVPYVQDVPFVLAPQLCLKNTSDLMQTQVDGILAVMTRQMSVDDKDDYNFALERSIQNECY